jgi:acyl-CoA synthetase (AMP-forming)/AMP-acid ligase II
MRITQSLHRSVQIDPDRVMTVDGERRITAKESLERVSKLASALISHGVKADDRVAILAQNSDRYHEVLLAVPWAAGVVVPLNSRWSPDEVAFALEDSGATALFVDQAFVEVGLAMKGRMSEIRTLIYMGSTPCPAGAEQYEALISAADPAEDAGRGEDDLYGIFFTGGTTGFPKGVMLSHDNLMVSTLSMISTGHFLTPRGRILHAAPMFHLADVGQWIGGNLLESTHYFMDAFSGAGVARSISDNHVTDVLLVPTMVQMVLDAADAHSIDLSPVSHVVYGASPITDTLLERARTQFREAEFTQAYGMSELAPVATILLPDDHSDPGLRRSGGRAAPLTEVRIVDSEDNELPRGTVGEIVARGGNVMLGYWNRPEETAQALRNGWMHTGDGGYMDEHGYVFIVDRMKDMIITGGENVYSVEVENVIASHPSVAMCAVIGLPDPIWGERVHAVVQPRPGTTVSLEELVAICRERISGYKSPRSLSLVDSMPLSPAGKVLKRELRAQAGTSSIANAT